MKLYEIEYKTVDNGVMTFKELVVSNTVESAISTFKTNRPAHVGIADHIRSVTIKQETIMVEIMT